MSFWSSERLLEKQKAVGLIDSFNNERVKHGAYELSLGSEFFITSRPKKESVRHGEQLIIPPGQFGLLIVQEKVNIPKNAIAFISIKAGKKFRGMVNVSGFHVDPGFKGHLKFSVYNAGSKDIVLSCGEPVFLIWFSDLDRTTTDTYNGNHAGKNEISADDVMNICGEIASPAALNDRLHEIERSIKLAKYIAVTVGMVLFLSIVGGLAVNYIWDKWHGDASSTKTTKDSRYTINDKGDNANASPVILITPRAKR